MKAIALISGGLDSTLAAKVMQNLGIELVCLNTVSPFCLCNHRSSRGNPCQANSVAKDLGLKLISLNVSAEFMEIVKKPKHGYGSNMNPCIDCRILLFRKAKEYMEKEAASFIVTGEVLGQRPMSQKLNTMKLIEKEAGLDGLVVRPLCAKTLEPTIPEKEGWINRDRLLGISGRGRRQQISLANEFGINDYPCPSGGCLLTDPEFSRRLKELMRYSPDFELNDIQLLKVGRHFRINERAKLIVGRNESENQRIINLARVKDFIFMPVEDLAGPTCLGRGGLTQEIIDFFCAITARYCDLDGNKCARIIYKQFPEKEEKVIEVFPLKEDQILRYRI